MAKVFKPGDIVQLEAGLQHDNPDGLVVVNQGVQEAHKKAWPPAILEGYITTIGLNNGGSYSFAPEKLVHCDRIRGMKPPNKVVVPLGGSKSYKHLKAAAAAVEASQHMKPNAKALAKLTYKFQDAEGSTYCGHFNEASKLVCERTANHPGVHAAWSENNTFYPRGVWTSDGKILDPNNFTYADFDPPAGLTATITYSEEKSVEDESPF